MLFHVLACCMGHEIIMQGLMTPRESDLGPNIDCNWRGGYNVGNWESASLIDLRFSGDPTICDRPL